VAYDPAADRWSAMAAFPGTDGPAPGEPAVWAGGRMLTWGVSGGSGDADAASDPGAGTADDSATGDTSGADEPAMHPAGGTYDPVADRWQAFASGPLSSRNLHTAVWTGQEMLIWGGIDPTGDNALSDGAAYRPE